MARIPEQVVERLKTEISVQRLAEARGVALTKHGNDLHGRCPFHDDRTPSLVITPAKNLWHCLGACQTGGSAIDWVMKAEGVSFRHAVELLVNDSLPLAAASSAPPPKHSTVKKLPTALVRDVEDAKLLIQVIEYYHETLLGSPEALDYLKRRGIGSEEAIKTLKLGFANRTLGYRLPASTRVEGAALRGQLQRLGLYRGSGHEHFSGSLVIPVISGSGEITEVYGRKLNDNLRAGTPLHLYLPGPHRGVWNVSALAAAKEIILCEALIDALTFWCAGYRNVTASYGVEGFTADHLAAFQSHGIERVLIAYDRDPAGDRAAEKLKAHLNAAGLDCYRILFPKSMDANEYALKVGPPQKSLGVAIRAAQWLGKGKPKPLTTAVANIPVFTEHSVRDPSPEPVLPLAAESAAPEKPTEVEIALPAQAIPQAPAPMPVAETKALGSEREHILVFGARRYRVRGLEKNLSHEILKVNLLASGPALDGGGEAGGNAVHVDTLDLYQARQRAAFVKSAAIELGVAEEIIKGDIGKVLLALEMEQAKLITAAQVPKVPAAVQIDEDARARAMSLLTSSDLIERIVTDFSSSAYDITTTSDRRPKLRFPHFSACISVRSEHSSGTDFRPHNGGI
jgi:DNA primase